MRSRPRGALLCALALGAASLAACGGGGARSAAVGGPPAAGGNGSLAYALPAAASLDPLAARALGAQIVSRQIFEPLVTRLDAPYGRRRGVPGAVLSSRHSGDYRVWSLRLRTGIRFQDGRLLDAEAVLANAERWRTSVAGRTLLPGFVAADDPRPDLVRFVFTDPVADLPRILADPRLGLVSPAALAPQSGRDASLTRVMQAGSGPFELGRRTGDGWILTRNRHWWGSAVRLGPALDAIGFRVRAGRRARLGLLRRGTARVAADLGRGAAARLRSDPLLTSVSPHSPHALGLERSVRGIATWRPRSMSGVWLTTVGRR